MPWPFIVALIALAIAAYMMWTVKSAKDEKSRLLRVETLSTAQLKELHQAAALAAGEGAFSEIVELEGKLAAGPDGILTSELSQTECVWHRYKVSRKYRDVRYDDEGRRKVETREEVVSDERTRDPLHLVDEHGEVVVVPSQNPKGAKKSVNRFEDKVEKDESKTHLKVGKFELNLSNTDRNRGDGDTLGYKYEEWILLPGTKVFVQGEATDRGGRLEIRDPKGKAPLVISTKMEQDLLDDADEKIENSKKFAMFAGGVAVVAAIAGVIMLLV